jgi:hypothetical protein
MTPVVHTQHWFSFPFHSTFLLSVRCVGKCFLGVNHFYITPHCALETPKRRFKVNTPQQWDTHSIILLRSELSCLSYLKTPITLCLHDGPQSLLHVLCTLLFITVTSRRSGLPLPHCLLSTTVGTIGLAAVARHPLPATLHVHDQSRCSVRRASQNSD